MANCDPTNEGPAFEIAPPTGTEECSNLHTTGPAPPCADLQACCNFFQLIKEGNSTTFIFSAGGPFELAIPGSNASYVCPPQTAPTFLSGPTQPSSYAQPGPLAAEICVPGMPIGTYQAFARMAIRAFTPGTHVQVRYRPDCTDSTVQYIVLDYYSPCPPQTTLGTAPTATLPEDFRTIDANLIVPATTCTPGFSLLVKTGQAQCASQQSLQPNIRNFQFQLLRLTARNLDSCEGSPLTGNIAIAAASTCI